MRSSEPRGTRISALGHHLPARHVGNAEIEAAHGLPEGWIAQRTGIIERRYAEPGDRLSDLAIAAGAMALANSDAKPGLLLLATSTPDQLLPPTAPLVAHRLGLSCGAIDMAGACSGFLFALALADAHCRATGLPVLVIAANILSRRIDLSDIGTQALFADGAGAVLVVPDANPASGLAAAELGSAGDGYDLIGIAPGATGMHMAGRELFHRAVDLQVAACEAVMHKAGMDAAAIDRWAPHQANRRIVSAVGQRLGIGAEHWVGALATTGNSSAATIPLALSLTTQEDGAILAGTSLFSAVGAGLLSAALIWQQD